MVISKGRATHSSFFTVRALKIEGAGRVAAIVSKKTAKNAVDRNKGRRLVYEAVKSAFSGPLPRYHIAIFAKDAIFKVAFADIAKELKAVFDKAGLLK